MRPGVAIIALLAAALGRPQAPPLPARPIAIPAPTSSGQPPEVAAPSLCGPAPTGLPPLPASVALPVLPQTCTQPVYPTPTSTVAVNTVAALQSALAAAKCGQAIELQPGIQYVGNFTVPGLACPASKPVLVVSAAVSSLPQWVAPSRELAGTAQFPALATPVSTATLTISDGAAGWYFAGLEFTLTPAAREVYPIVAMGEQTTTVAALPHDIVFDRCLVHPAPCPASGVCNYTARGIDLNAVNGVVISSNIWGIVHPGQDTQAVNVYNSPGPILISNNELEASGENIMLNTECPPTGYGPGVWGIPSCPVPSDVTITRNHFIKQREWRGLPAGCAANTKLQCYDVKNDVECKHCASVLVDSNWFDTTFMQAQDEFIIMNCIFSGPYVCRDLTVSNNLFEHGPMLAVIVGNGTPQTAQRILFRNNLAIDISALNWGGVGLSFQLQNTNGFIADHDTILNRPSLYMNGLNFSDAPPSTNTAFRWTNNFSYGSPFANGMSPGRAIAALPNPVFGAAVFVGDWWPNGNNYSPPMKPAYPPGILTPRSSATPVANQPGCQYNNKPIAACWALDWAVVGFADFDGANSGTNPMGLVLGPSSPYRGKGTDSMDIGANVLAVLKAIGLTGPQHSSPIKPLVR